MKYELLWEGTLLRCKRLAAHTDEEAIREACVHVTEKKHPVVLLRDGRVVGVAYGNCPIWGRQFRPGLTPLHIRAGLVAAGVE